MMLQKSNYLVNIPLFGALLYSNHSEDDEQYTGKQRYDPVPDPRRSHHFFDIFPETGISGIFWWISALYNAGIGVKGITCWKVESASVQQNTWFCVFC